MANCKICGQHVRSSLVIHSACWQSEAEKLAAVFCDEYCRWPRAVADEESLEDLHCSNCALIKVLNLGL